MKKKQEILRERKAEKVMLIKVTLEKNESLLEEV